MLVASSGYVYCVSYILVAKIDAWDRDPIFNIFQHRQWTKPTSTMGVEANPQRIPRECRLQHDFSVQGDRARISLTAEAGSRRCFRIHTLPDSTWYSQCIWSVVMSHAPPWPSLAPTDSGKQQRHGNVHDYDQIMSVCTGLDTIAMCRWETMPSICLWWLWIHTLN